MNSPTRVRYSILFLLCLLAMITYMDRAANGSAKKDIMADLGVVEADFFIVLMAFQLAYAIFEIPSGWLGDTHGPRSTLLRVVLWWSTFVALTAFTGTTIPLIGFYVGFTALIVIQFLFGVGEAGAFPNISKALYNWFPASDRGFAKSAVWMSARLMGGLTPLLWVVLTVIFGLNWRQAMWLFAAVAAVWCAVFAWFFTNTPREHSWVNDAERAVIDRGRHVHAEHQSVPWKKLFSSRNLWALCAMYVVTNFCWYFLMYNLPRTMQKENAGLNDTTNGKMLLALLSGSPLLIGMLGCIAGGAFSDYYIRKTGNRKWGRRIPGMIGYVMAGLCYFAAVGVKWFADDAASPGQPMPGWFLPAFAACLILMGFFNDLIMGPAWATAQDIGQRYSATVSGTMNMCGNLLGAVSTIFITGMLEKRYPNNGEYIYYCFIMYGVVYFLGVVAWLFIDAGKPILDDQTAAIS